MPDRMSDEQKSVYRPMTPEQIEALAAEFAYLRKLFGAGLYSPSIGRRQRPFWER